MIGFFKTILKMAFIGGVVFLFFTACSAHKRCGDAAAKKKYHGKRYVAALSERDSLCNVAAQRQQEITGLQGEVSALKTQYEEFQKQSGSQLNKLSTDLGDKQTMLRQREERLRHLESILRRQDSLL